MVQIRNVAICKAKVTTRSHSPYFHFVFHDSINPKAEFFSGSYLGCVTDTEDVEEEPRKEFWIGVVFISLVTFGHTSLQLKGNLREWECLFYLTFIYFYVPQTDENKVDGVSAPKGQSGSSSRGPGDGGNKDHWKEADRYACPFISSLCPDA